MSSPLPTPTKEVDIEFLVFVQRYATDLLKWDILTFFAHHPDSAVSLLQLAKQIGRTPYSIGPEVGDLEILGILEQRPAADGQPVYQLTQDPSLRRMTLKFAEQLTLPPQFGYGVWPG